MFTSLSFLLYHATLLLTPASLTHSCHITQPFITIAVLSTMLALMARSRGADFVQTIYFVLFRPSAYNIHKSTTNLLCAASELQIHLIKAHCMTEWCSASTEYVAAIRPQFLPTKQHALLEANKKQTKNSQKKHLTKSWQCNRGVSSNPFFLRFQSFT